MDGYDGCGFDWQEYACNYQLDQINRQWVFVKVVVLFFLLVLMFPFLVTIGTTGHMLIAVVVGILSFGIMALCWNDDRLV